MHVRQGFADSLAIAGEHMHDDEIIFHIINGLPSTYKVIGSPIRVCNSPINFVKLHDKLTDFDRFIKRSASSPTFDVPVTAKGGKHFNFVHQFFEKCTSEGVPLLTA